MNVSLVSSDWDGKTIPDGQQCNRFGGQGNTPKLNVSNIPVGTTSLITEYSDQDYPELNNGGHRKIGYTLSKEQQEVVVPSVPGHSFELIAPFTVVAPKLHQVGILQVHIYRHALVVKIICTTLLLKQWQAKKCFQNPS